MTPERKGILVDIIIWAFFVALVIFTVVGYVCDWSPGPVPMPWEHG